MRQAWLPLLASSLLLVSCSEGVDEAKQGVTDFRAAVSNKSYADIFRNADAEMRQSGTEAGFVEFMTALDTKLGPWKSADDPVWNVFTSTNAGRKVFLTYKSQFANGPGTENFTWRIDNGKAVLLGYHVDSPLWVTK